MAHLFAFCGGRLNIAIGVLHPEIAAGERSALIDGDRVLMLATGPSTETYR